MTSRLYLISPPTLGEGFTEVLAAALAAGDVAAFQLRLKEVDTKTLHNAIAMLKPVCRAHGVAFILNDHPALAVATACDGVHIGKDDGDTATVRAMLPDGMVLGVSCYDSLERAQAAAQAGADYVAFGAMFPTTTKASATPADADILSVWRRLSPLPSAAIGGITLDNLGRLLPHRPNFLALSRAVWHHPQGAAAAVRAFNTLLDEFNAAA